MKIRGVLALCVALTLATGATPAFAQNIKTDNKQPKRNKTEQADLEMLMRAVDAAATGSAPVSDYKLTWRTNDFVKGQGGTTYIPFTIDIDPSGFTKSAVALSLRVVDKAHPPTPIPVPAGAAKDSKDKKAAAAPPPALTGYAWDTIHFIELPKDGHLQRAIQLPAGDYELFVSVKEKSTDEKAMATKVGLMRQPLTVPDFGKPELQTSSIILAKAIEPMQTAVKPEEQQDNPYVFGPMKIVPTADGKFSKAGELNVVFWIYGAGETNAKPDVQVEYAFYQKLDSGEKYFNRTAPQMLNATTLPPEFSAAQGHQLPGNLVIPLASFPPGDYRLEIKVTDKAALGKTITQNVNFAVTAS